MRSVSAAPKRSAARSTPTRAQRRDTPKKISFIKNLSMIPQEYRN
ncbi:MAG: hypothetical protein NZ455_06525 [Bacteroidia bacterium]|nr:hypothetical protein [Bacteroidia bacterium]MDW8347178.1 hypothetical protein [Bacteroidia bacterium]